MGNFMSVMRLMVFLESVLFLAMGKSPVFCAPFVQTNPEPTVGKTDKNSAGPSEEQEDEKVEDDDPEPVMSIQISEEVYKKHQKAPNPKKKKGGKTLPEKKEGQGQTLQKKCIVRRTPSVVKIIDHVGKQLHKTTPEDSNAVSETAPVATTPSIKGTRGSIHPSTLRETFSKGDQEGKTIFKEDPTKESPEIIEKRQLLGAQHSLPVANRTTDPLNRPTDEGIKNDPSSNLEHAGKRNKHDGFEFGDN